VNGASQSPLTNKCDFRKRKKAMPEGMAFSFEFIAGDHLISHTVARAVPSAQRGLTSVFGMGTGDPSQYGHRQIEAFSRREAPSAGSLEPKS
jgi:hypothetical protein